jgi:hypothetical protein
VFHDNTVLYLRSNAMRGAKLPALALVAAVAAADGSVWLPLPSRSPLEESSSSDCDDAEPPPSEPDHGSPCARSHCAPDHCTPQGSYDIRLVLSADCLKPRLMRTSHKAIIIARKLGR